MEFINQIINFIQKLFKWWFIVLPWEQALFIRAGKKTKLLPAGIYMKIPFLDTVFVQTNRMRMVDLSMQTMTTKDGNAITIRAAVGYSIGNIETLYRKMHHPEMTLASMIMSEIGEFVIARVLSELSPETIKRHVESKMEVTDYGLVDISVRITTFAAVKTLRLIQDQSHIFEGLTIDKHIE